MEILLYGAPGALLAEVSDALQVLRPRKLMVADNWTRLREILGHERFKIAILCLDGLGSKKLAAADQLRKYAVRAGTATVLVTDTPAEHLGFLVALKPPVSANLMASAIRKATTAAPPSITGSGGSLVGNLTDAARKRSAQRKPLADPKFPRENSRIISSGNVERQLPPMKRGAIGRDAHPLRLLFAHHVSESTGHITLRLDGIEREIFYHKGLPGLLGARIIEPSRRNRIAASLVWVRGTYEFREHSVDKDKFCPFGHVLELIHTTIRDLSLNQVAALLNPYFKHYPVRTERVLSHRSLLNRLDGAWDFLESCKAQTLESIVGAAGGDISAALKNALFAMYTDLVVMLPNKAQEPVRLQYRERGPRSDVQDRIPAAVAERLSPPKTAVQTTATTTASERARPQGGSPSGSTSKRRPNELTLERAPGRSAQSSRGHTTDRGAASASASGSANRREQAARDEAIFNELADLAARFQAMTAYEVFELEVGCGRKSVRVAYYKMVKTHHPDVYGLGRSPEIKPLAEMVFHQIQRANSELMKAERNTSPASTQERASAVDTSSKISAIELTGTGTAKIQNLRAPRTSSARRSAPRATATTSDRDTKSAGFAPSSMPSRGATATSSHSGPRPSEAYRNLSRTAEHKIAMTRHQPAPSTKRSARPTASPASVTRTSQRNPTQRASASKHPVTGVVKAPEAPQPAPVHEPLPPTTEAERASLLKQGIALISAGAADKALPFLDRALLDDPENVELHIHKVWANYLLDESRRSATRQELMSIIANENSESALLFLGKIHEADDDAERAARFYSRCLDINPNNREAQQRLRLFRMRNERDANSLFSGIFSKKKKGKK